MGDFHYNVFVRCDNIAMRSLGGSACFVHECRAVSALEGLYPTDMVDSFNMIPDILQQAPGMC